jgi:adenylate kinase family enzyme
VLDLVEERMLLHREAEGFIIAGFPRDVLQASAFQNRSFTRECVVSSTKIKGRM